MRDSALKQSPSVIGQNFLLMSEKSSCATAL